MSEVQAKGISGRLTLAARDGTVQLLEHSEWYTWRADDVAAVVAEAKRQRDGQSTREFFFNGNRYIVAAKGDGTVTVRHHTVCAEYEILLAERCIAAYRELVEANKHE